LDHVGRHQEGIGEAKVNGIPGFATFSLLYFR
jgi:hypothetical protein